MGAPTVNAEPGRHVGPDWVWLRVCWRLVGWLMMLLLLAFARNKWPPYAAWPAACLPSPTSFGCQLGAPLTQCRSLARSAAHPRALSRRMILTRRSRSDPRLFGRPRTPPASRRLSFSFSSSSSLARCDSARRRLTHTRSGSRSLALLRQNPGQQSPLGRACWQSRPLEAAGGKQ